MYLGAVSSLLSFYFGVAVWINLWHRVHSYMPSYPAIMTFASCMQVSWVIVVCAKTLPVTIPVTVAITAILAVHSLTVGANLLPPRNRSIHGIIDAFILINPTSMKHHRQRWRNVSNVVVWICISARKDWIDYSFTYYRITTCLFCLYKPVTA